MSLWNGLIILNSLKKQLIVGSILNKLSFLKFGGLCEKWCKVIVFDFCIFSCNWPRSCQFSSVLAKSQTEKLFQRFLQYIKQTILHLEERLLCGVSTRLHLSLSIYQFQPIQKLIRLKTIGLDLTFRSCLRGVPSRDLLSSNSSFFPSFLSCQYIYQHTHICT